MGDVFIVNTPHPARKRLNLNTTMS